MNDEARASGYTNYMTIGSQLNVNARVFCPMQRQMSLKYALDTYHTNDEMSVDVGTKEPNEYVSLPFFEGDLWGGKSLHTNDGSAFYANMHEDLKLRVANFLAARDA